MERGEDQVTRLRRGQGDRYSLQVAHLADENDVGILAQGCPERSGERLGILADLDLLDQGLAVLVLVLEGIFDGDDVLRLRPVDLAEEGRQRAALA